MNKVILMGRLTRDPEVRAAGSTTVARFSLAVDRRFKREGEPEADFFNCTAFGKQADFVERYLRRGTKMVVVGRIQNDNYTNREGQKVYSVQILVDELEFAESKNAQGGSDFSQPAGTGFGQGSDFAGSRPQPSQAQAVDDDFMSIPDAVDELPFGAN
jgi:single-strand DNA-binding protein